MILFRNDLVSYDQALKGGASNSPESPVGGDRQQGYRKGYPEPERSWVSMPVQAGAVPYRGD